VLHTRFTVFVAVVFTATIVLFAGCEVTTVTGPSTGGEYCPITYPYLCTDGTCALTLSDCSAYSNGCPTGYPYLCSDGTCAGFASDCGQTNGCPNDAPYLCGDNTCAFNSDYCSTNFCPSESPYDCGDGTCAYTPSDCVPTAKRIRPLQARKISSRALKPNLN
jgi:hypothetical protein